MKNLIITILSFIVIVMAACWCKPEDRNTANSINRPDFDYNINYTVPKYENQEYAQTFNYDYTNSVYITRTGDCYHIGNCSHAKKSAGSMSRSQAIKKGYRACYYCCY